MPRLSKMWHSCVRSESRLTALACGQEAHSPSIRNKPMPVIIPLFRATHSVLIRCKRAEKVYLVALQMRMEEHVTQPAVADAAGLNVMK